MNFRSRVTLTALFVAASLTAGVAAAHAQSLWLPRDSKYTVMLEFVRPSLERVDADLMSGAFFLGGRATLGPQAALVAELPYVRNGSTEPDYYYGYPYIYESVKQSGSTIGNPYIGVETVSATSPIFGEIGVRLPIASDDNFENYTFATAFYADQARWLAFVPDVWTVQTAFNLREVTPKHVAYRLRVNPFLTIPTDEGDNDLWLGYAFDIGYHGPWARVSAGTSGTAILTADYGNLGERSRTQFELHGDFLSGAIRPGLGMRVPLGSYAEDSPLSFAVTLAWCGGLKATTD